MVWPLVIGLIKVHIPTAAMAHLCAPQPKVLLKGKVQTMRGVRFVNAEEFLYTALLF